MNTLTAIIKTQKQYDQYCKVLEALVPNNTTKPIADEIEMLTLLIEKWDDEHNTFEDVDPITLIKSLIQERSLSSKELSEILQVSKSLVSEILNYKKGLSKEIIRKLAAHFKVSQEAFNRPYKLKLAIIPFRH